MIRVLVESKIDRLQEMTEIPAYNTQEADGGAVFGPQEGICSGGLLRVH